MSKNAVVKTVNARAAKHLARGRRAAAKVGPARERGRRRVRKQPGGASPLSPWQRSLSGQ